MQSPYGGQVVLLGGAAKPVDGFLKVDRSTPSIAVHQSKMILGFTMAMLGGQAEPFESLIIIDTCLITIAKFYLGKEISQFASFMEPEQRFFRGARGLHQSSQIKLGEVIPLAGRTSIPFPAFFVAFWNPPQFPVHKFQPADSEPGHVPVGPLCVTRRYPSVLMDCLLSILSPSFLE